LCKSLKGVEFFGLFCWEGKMPVLVRLYQACFGGVFMLDGKHDVLANV
jgi:hypothetical protein